MALCCFCGNGRWASALYHQSRRPSGFMDFAYECDLMPNRKRRMRFKKPGASNTTISKELPPLFSFLMHDADSGREKTERKQNHNESERNHGKKQKQSSGCDQCDSVMTGETALKDSDHLESSLRIFSASSYATRQRTATAA